MSGIASLYQSKQDRYVDHIWTEGGGGKRWFEPKAKEAEMEADAEASHTSHGVM